MEFTERMILLSYEVVEQMSKSKIDKHVKDSHSVKTEMDKKSTKSVKSAKGAK